MSNPTIIKRLYIAIVLTLLVVFTAGCSENNSDIDEIGKWVIVDAGLPSALISIWGSSVNDMWVVGADSGDGIGPMVLRKQKIWHKLNAVW